jgi:superfamily II helicase
VIASKARLRAVRKIQRIAGYRLPDFAFHGANLEMIDGGINYEQLDSTLRDQLLRFQKDFLNCNCKGRPLCGCPEQKFVLMLIELRTLGLDHREIHAHLLDEYGIDLFPADILSFLEDAVHRLEAIRRVAELEGQHELAKKTEAAIKGIEQ